MDIPQQRIVYRSVQCGKRHVGRVTIDIALDLGEPRSIRVDDHRVAAVSSGWKWDADFLSGSQIIELRLGVRLVGRDDQPSSVVDESDSAIALRRNHGFTFAACRIQQYHMAAIDAAEIHRDGLSVGREADLAETDIP